MIDFICDYKISNMSYENMLEKTYNIFHTSDMFMQQQYRECHFTKYFELITCLLVAE